jgi:hypothetical protein
MFPISKIRASAPAIGLIALLSVTPLAVAEDVRRDYSIPMLDLTQEDSLFSTVERRKGYLGHPSTVLMRDGKTLLVAYPDGHGRGNLILRRSTDAGVTWKPVEIAAQRVEETPILYRLDLPGGGERILLTTCRPRQTVMEWMWSDDGGNTWSERQSWKLEGPNGIIVALTYGHWDLAPGSKHPNHPDGRGLPPYIMQVKLDPKKTDAWVADPAKRVKPK